MLILFETQVAEVMFDTVDGEMYVVFIVVFIPFRNAKMETVFRSYLLCVENGVLQYGSG